MLRHKVWMVGSGSFAWFPCARLRLSLLAWSLLAAFAGLHAGPRLQQPSADTPSEVIRLPNPTGPYHVGRVSFSRVDTSRLEQFTQEDPSDHRQVLLHLWYPTDQSSAVPAPYIEGLADDELFRRSYSFVGFDNLIRVRVHATAGARISAVRRRYPVVLFSHGLGMVSALYSLILENLASHGFVVVGVDHPYVSSAFTLPSGQLVTRRSRRQFPGPGASNAQQEEVTRIREEEAIIQAEDLRFALSELEKLNAFDPKGRLAGRLDLKHVGVFGHSRGGFAASHACFLDRRFKACLNLDGYRLTSAVMKDGLRQPYMHIEEIAPWEPPPTDEELAATHQTRQQAQAEATAAAQERVATFQRMLAGAYLVTVKGAKHMSFSDAPFISPEKYSSINIDAGRALRITNAYVLAFFDKTLRGRRSLLLEGASPDYPEVTLEVFRPGHPKTMHSSKMKPQ